MSQPPPSLRPTPRQAVAALATMPPIGRPIRRRYAMPLLLVLGVAGGLALLLLHDNVRYYRIDSGSMEPTLAVGSRVATEAGIPLKIGEIVVFHPPQGAVPDIPACGATGEGTGFARPCGVGGPEASVPVLVKRIVAGPGDLVAVRAGRAVVDGVTSSRPVVPCAGPNCNFPIPIRVPPGEYFMLGDNRAVSDDSRFWGPVPAGSIVGVVVRCWPLQTACRAR